MSTFEICECSSRLNVVYPRQYIMKCCSCSMQSSLHTKHVRSSTGINAPLFSYLPVCIHSAWHLNLSLVRLTLCAGFVININCRFQIDNRVLKQRRFWAADVNRKFMCLLLAHFHARPMSYKALILAFTTWLLNEKGEIRIKAEKSRLPVDVRGSKTSVLKLPNYFWFPCV